MCSSFPITFSTYNVIVRNRVNHTEFCQIILVRSIVSVPGHHIKRTVLLSSGKHLAIEFGEDVPWCVILLDISGHRGHKVPGICQPVRTNRTQVRQFEMFTKDFKYITTNRLSFDEIDRESDTTLDDTNFVRSD